MHPHIDRRGTAYIEVTRLCVRASPNTPDLRWELDVFAWFPPLLPLLHRHGGTMPPCICSAKINRYAGTAAVRGRDVHTPMCTAHPCTAAARSAV